MRDPQTKHYTEQRKPSPIILFFWSTSKAPPALGLTTNAWSCHPFVQLPPPPSHWHPARRISSLVVRKKQRDGCAPGPSACCSDDFEEASMLFCSINQSRLLFPVISSIDVSSLVDLHQPLCVPARRLNDQPDLFELPCVLARASVSCSDICSAPKRCCDASRYVES